MDKYNPLTSGLPSLPFKPGCGSESILSKSKSPLSPDDPVYPAAEPFITWSIVLYQYSHPCPPELIFIVFSSCTCSRINSQASIHSGSSIINSVSSSFKIEPRSEEHTSELQSRFDLVCRLLLEKKKQHDTDYS